MGREGEGRGQDRLHHEQRQEERDHDSGRGPGQVRPRHPGNADLVAARPNRAARADERRHDAANCAERRGQRHREISRPARRQMACCSLLHRQPDQGTLHPHRSDEEIRQYRRAGNVSGRLPAQSGQLDDGYLPEGRGSLLQGRRSFRNRPGRNFRLCRHGRRDLPVVRSAARRRQGKPDGQDRRGTSGARVLQEADRLPAARLGGMGRCVEQQVAGVR